MQSLRVKPFPLYLGQALLLGSFRVQRLSGSIIGLSKEKEVLAAPVGQVTVLMSLATAERVVFSGLKAGTPVSREPKGLVKGESQVFVSLTSFVLFVGTTLQINLFDTDIVWFPVFCSAKSFEAPQS